MKTVMLVLVLLMSKLYPSFGQSPNTVRIKSEQNISTSVPFYQKYQYSEFIKGKLTYLNGNETTAKFNYNLLLGEIQLISQKRDTVSLAHKEAIKQIKIGDDIFHYYPQNGFLKIKTEYDSIKLASKQLFNNIDTEKKGAYGQSTGTSSITNYSGISTSNGSASKLENSGDLVYAKELTYYIIDNNKKVFVANRAGILKVFSTNKKLINQYLKENKIDFRNENELNTLLKYCVNL